MRILHPQAITSQRIRTALLVCVAALHTAALAAQPTQPLRITDLSVAKTERSLQLVRVKVRNVTSQPQSGLVWYLLAPPDAPEPWLVQDYASEERHVDLAPGADITLEFAGPNVNLDGRFGLSVWVHAVRKSTGERFHSDASTANAPVVIAPAFSFSVDYLLGPRSQETSAGVLVRFSVRNNQDRRADVALDYRITGPGETSEPDMRRLTRTAAVEPGVDYVVTIRHEGALPRGRLKLTGWLYELQDGHLNYRGSDETTFAQRD